MRVPENGRFVVVTLWIERSTECLVVLVVADAAATRAPAGRAVMDRAEARRGEGGEDTRVGGDMFGDALAAAQAGGDQVEGVAAVDLGAGRTPSRTAVVAAHEELAGREVGGVEVLEDAADLTGRGVDVVLGAVAIETDRVDAAAEPGELTEDTGQGPVLGQLREFRERGRCGAGEDGDSPSDWLGQE